MAAPAFASVGRFLAAAALAAAASLQAGNAAGHESHRHRSAVPERAAISAADDAQSRHDFATAEALLERQLATRPDDLEARLMRANLHLLAGEFEAARSDCQVALRSGALYAGTVCLASAQTGPGSLERARRMIAALGERDEADVELMRWRLLTEADLASRAGEEASSRFLLERAYALDPRHEEVRTQLAERVLNAGDPARALSLALAPEPSPARMVVRLRAAIAVGDARAPGWRNELAEALAADRHRGIPPHWREEGELALYADKDAMAAIGLARRNFETQKDTRDLRLLALAASAQGDREALSEIGGWLASSGFEDRVTLALLTVP
jgi:tetratricopeptide (TPR) repeat protein